MPSAFGVEACETESPVPEAREPKPGGPEWQGPRTAAVQAVRGLVRLPPGPGPRLWIAVRAAVSIGAPLAALTLAGHEGLGLQAASGAFLALFAAGSGAAERARVLPFVAVALLACAGLGAMLAPYPALLAVGLVAVTIVVSALAFAFRLGPPGPVFFVLVYGLAGNVTAVVDGQRIIEPWPFLAAISAGVAFSYLVALTPLLLPRERARPPRPLRELLPGPWVGPGERELILRVAIVAAASTAICVWLVDPHRAYWAVSSGVAVVGLSAIRTYSVGRGLHRTVGTLVGVGVYLLIAPLGGIPLAVVLLITALQFAIELVVVRNYALALVFITPLVLLITGAATGGANLSDAAWERLGDTVIGSAIAIATGALHRRPR